MSPAVPENLLAPTRLLGRILGLMAGAPPTAGLVEHLQSDELSWPTLASLASAHLVTPALAPALRRAGLMDGIDGEAGDYLSAMHELNLQRNRRLVEQLHDVVPALNRAGIEPVLLKGAAQLVLDLYGDAGARVVADIDLLVPEDGVAAGVAALEELGYAPIPTVNMDHTKHHPPLRRADEVACVELHRRPVDRQFARLLPEPFAAGGTRVAVGRGHAIVPGGEAAIAHNIVHAQPGHLNVWPARLPLRDALDLVLLGAHHRGRIDWDALARRFAAGGHGGCFAFYLSLTYELLGLEPPIEVRLTGTARLARARWRLHTAGRLHGVQRAAEGLELLHAIWWDFTRLPDERRRMIRLFRELGLARSIATGLEKIRSGDRGAAA